MVIERNCYIKFRCTSKLIWKHFVFWVIWIANAIIFWQMWNDILGFEHCPTVSFAHGLSPRLKTYPLFNRRAFSKTEVFSKSFTYAAEFNMAVSFNIIWNVWKKDKNRSKFFFFDFDVIFFAYASDDRVFRLTFLRLICL